MPWIRKILIVSVITSFWACTEGRISQARSLGEQPKPTIDPALVQRLILERVFPALGQVQQDPAPLRALLTEDVRLRWPNKIGEGPDEFIRVVGEAFSHDLKLFVIAAKNYKYLETACGKSDPSLRPVGLPDSIEIKTFNLDALTPDMVASYPGLLMPAIDSLKMIQGDTFASDRFLHVAKFKHSWFSVGQPAYVYIDRYVVKQVNGDLKVQEYEFTLNTGEFPSEPTPLTACP